MKTCDLVSAVGQLQRAANKLHDRWLQTEPYWNDSVRREFAKEHLEPLLPQLRATVAAIHRLSEIVEKGERECLDPDRESDSLLS